MLSLTVLLSAGSFIYTLITILIIIICVLLGAVVLIQNPKGGGVNSTFSGASQQIFGAGRSTDVIEKTTWTLAGLLLVFCLCSAFFIDKRARVSSRAAADKVNTTTTAPIMDQDEVSKRLKETGGFNAPMQTAPAQPQGQPQQAPPAQPEKK